MAILNVNMGTIGESNLIPRIVRIDTNNTVAEITVAGFLDSLVQQGYAFSESDMALVTTKTAVGAAPTGVGWYDVSFTTPNWSLVSPAAPGTVVLPTVAGRLPHFTNVTGTLSDANLSVFNGGNISAGLSGTAGTLSSLPATVLRGSLILAAVDNTGNTAVTISNAAHGQASVYSIPDGGQATSEIIIADSAGTQNITSGALQVDAGAISIGLAAGGFAGSLISFSNTANMGSLRLLTLDSAGDFAVTISNASHAQASVVSIPDGGQATSEFLIADSAATQNITSGGLQVDAGAVSIGLAAGGFAGSLIAYSNTATSGSLRLLTVDSAGDFAVTISNASHAQASVVSIPDGGQATSEFIIADSAATQNITSGALQVDAGAITGGLLAGGFAGSLVLWTNTTASGSLALLAVDNATGDFDTIISNAAAVGQDQTITVPDVGAATGSFMVSALVASDPAANIVTKNITVGQAAVATAGEVTIQASAGTDQYKILEIYLNSGGTNFSGGGGDRLGQVTDGTTVYSVLPAANMQALTNERWGTTAVAYPAAAAINTSTAAAADLVFSYSGGATDYTAGSLVITVILEKVA